MSIFARHPCCQTVETEVVYAVTKTQSIELEPLTLNLESATYELSELLQTTQPL
jgi:hypothetical protein